MNMPGATNQPVTVELKNGHSVNGQLLACSPTMNLLMKNVKLMQPFQEPQLMQFLSIRGNQVRQIILPEDLNLESILASSATRIKGAGAGPGAKADSGPRRGGSSFKRGAPRGRGRGF